MFPPCFSVSTCIRNYEGMYATDNFSLWSWRLHAVFRATDCYSAHRWCRVWSHWRQSEHHTHTGTLPRHTHRLEVCPAVWMTNNVPFYTYWDRRNSVISGSISLRNYTGAVGEESGMGDEPTEEEAAEPVTLSTDPVNEESCSNSDDEMVWFWLIV